MPAPHVTVRALHFMPIAHATGAGLDGSLGVGDLLSRPISEVGSTTDSRPELSGSVLDGSCRIPIWSGGCATPQTSGVS